MMMALTRICSATTSTLMSPTLVCVLLLMDRLLHCQDLVWMSKPASASWLNTRFSNTIPTQRCQSAKKMVPSLLFNAVKFPRNAGASTGTETFWCLPQPKCTLAIEMI
uniref:BLTX27 n=1 Tax=Nephila pilipes TaxID=299642 RepID=A0A076L1I3_NEPPI|nr:BLTX27 [Nephila pilipes]